MFINTNTNGKLYNNIGLDPVLKYFNSDKGDDRTLKTINLNRKALKYKEQLKYGKYNYTAFIEKVNLLNEYIINQLKSKGISARLSDKVNLTKPQIRYDRYKTYAHDQYQYIILDNYLDENTKCKHESEKSYYITIMPDRAPANNPIVRINLGLPYGIASGNIKSFKDGYRQHNDETHKFDKQTDVKVHLSHDKEECSYHASVVEQDDGKINLNDFIDFTVKYKEIIDAQSNLLIKERKKLGLKTARDLRPLNKTLEENGFEVIEECMNLTDYTNKALDGNMGYYSRCKYKLGWVKVSIEYDKTDMDFKYDIAIDARDTTYTSGEKISRGILTNKEKFNKGIEIATQISKQIQLIRSL